MRLIALALIHFILVVSVKGQASKDIATASIKVVSIDAMNEDYTDLVPLKKNIGDSRVVVLGEISHDDGSSFAAKVRLIKFLHKEMGFNVVAWEAGFLDCWMMDRAFQNKLPLDEAKTFMMRGGWDNSEYIEPLFQYVQQTWNTPQPLRMAGFDDARPPKGYSDYLEIVNELRTILGDKGLDSSWTVADSLVKAVTGFIGNAYSKSLSIPEEKKGEAFFRNLLNLLNKKADSLTNINAGFKAKLLFLKSLIYDIEAYKAGKYLTNRSWNLIRDNFMGERFGWLLNQLYPGQKIIVWAATAHTIRNTQSIFRPGIENAVYMGHYVSNYLKGSLYTIAFTTYEGQRGAIFLEGDRRKNREYKEVIPPPSKESYEDWAHSLKSDYLITDLKNQKNTSWLKKEFMARPLGFIEDKATWSNVVDAFFFIDKMQPDRFLPLK